jgi:hypothetical protein
MEELIKEYDAKIRLAVQFESAATCEGKCARLMREAIERSFEIKQTV